jgi:hypothetical protein
MQGRPSFWTRATIRRASSLLSDARDDLTKLKKIFREASRRAKLKEIHSGKASALDVLTLVTKSAQVLPC